jgi:hypothetical protein
MPPLIAPHHHHTHLAGSPKVDVVSVVMQSCLIRKAM